MFAVRLNPKIVATKVALSTRPRMPCGARSLASEPAEPLLPPHEPDPAELTDVVPRVRTSLTDALIAAFIVTRLPETLTTVAIPRAVLVAT